MGFRLEHVMPERSPRVSRTQSSNSGNTASVATQRLERCANAALNWLSRNIYQFSPLEKFDPSPRIQPFTELAILYERLHSVASHPLAVRLRLPYHLRHWRRFLF